jgi:hypothetical protein
MPLVASRLSRLTLNFDRVVSSGSIRVQNIYVSNATSAPIEVVFKDNNDHPLLNMVISAYNSDCFATPWIADNGLKVGGLDDGNVVVTVAHTSVGA